MLFSAVFLFRLWFVSSLPLSGDEAYHWEWSRHLAWGYYDHPPLTAFLIWCATAVFGRSAEFTVRLPALLMLSGTAAICWHCARHVVKARGGEPAAAERAGFLAGFLVLVVPIFAGLAVYMSTDPPLILFWTLALCSFYHAVNGRSWWAWVVFGAAVGLALTSKLLAFLLLPGLAAFLLASPDDRAWWREPQLYVAAAVGAVVFAPFVFWNAAHEWATFMFNFVYRQRAAGGFSVRFVPEFLLGQMLALSPLIFGLAVVCLMQGVVARRERRDRAVFLLALSGWFPLLYFLYVSFRRRVGLHWPAAGWVGPLLALAVCWAEAPPDRRRVWGRWTVAGASLACAVTALMHGLVHIPASWLEVDWSYPGSPSRINIRQHVERFGWRELGRKVETVRDEMLAAQRAQRIGERGVFVIGSEYGLTALVAFYTPSQLPTHLWSPRKTHGENYRFWDRFDKFKGMDAVYVTKRESSAREAVAKLREHFREVMAPEEVPITVQGRQLRSFYLIRCFGFDGRAPVW